MSDDFLLACCPVNSVDDGLVIHHPVGSYSTSPTHLQQPENKSRMASPEATLLGLSRLFTRLEHNLLSPSADLDTLRKDEFQRMRVGAVRFSPT